MRQANECSVQGKSSVDVIPVDISEKYLECVCVCVCACETEQNMCM